MFIKRHKVISFFLIHKIFYRFFKNVFTREHTRDMLKYQYIIMCIEMNCGYCKPWPFYVLLQKVINVKKQFLNEEYNLFCIRNAPGIHAYVGRQMVDAE